MAFRRPVVVEIIEDFHTTIKLVQEAAFQYPTPSESLYGIHSSTGEYIFKPDEPRVSDWHPKKQYQMLCLALDNLLAASLEYEITCFVSQDFGPLSLSTTVEAQEGNMFSHVHEQA